jgi:hypothetical protein
VETEVMSDTFDPMQQWFASIVAAMRDEPGVAYGSQNKRGFGASALKVDGRIFAMMSSRGGFVVKLPRERVEALERAGQGRRFDPGHGRLMREWLAVEQATYEQCLSLAREALQFVRA